MGPPLSNLQIPHGFLFDARNNLHTTDAWGRMEEISCERDQQRETCIQIGGATIQERENVFE